MPTYDYICSACGTHHEIFQKITDDPIRKCPACKKSKLERQFGTGAAIVFKGSGFYQTDYRSESYKKAASSDSSSNAGSESKSESKGEKSTGSSGDSKPVSETKSPKPNDK